MHNKAAVKWHKGALTATLGSDDMIGRKQESEELNRIYNRNKAELVAIYGRRRVGKTYLVDETFEGRITFRHAGLSPADESPACLNVILPSKVSSTKYVFPTRLLP